jgi:hypothetical protein
MSEHSRLQALGRPACRYALGLTHNRAPSPTVKARE